MPEGTGTVLDNCCLMFISNMWSGTKHDNKKVPVLTVGGLGGTLQTGRSLDYLNAGDEQPQTMQSLSGHHGPHGRSSGSLRRCDDALERLISSFGSQHTHDFVKHRHLFARRNHKDSAS